MTQILTNDQRLDDGTGKKKGEKQKTLLIPQRKSKVYERVKHLRTRRTGPRANTKKSCKGNETERKVKKFKELTWEEKSFMVTTRYESITFRGFVA